MAVLGKGKAACEGREAARLFEHHLDLGVALAGDPAHAVQLFGDHPELETLRDAGMAPNGL
jgi:hypothetical protein